MTVLPVKISLFVFLFFSLFYFQVLAKNNKAITLATTAWCPYTCGEDGLPNGFIGDKIKKLFKKHDLTLVVEQLPWSRALHLAHEGKVDGLLTATFQEAPTLIFTNQPIGSYQMCFYTEKSNPWQYEEPLNFADNRITVIQDYGYGEPLDSYVKSTANVMAISGENSTLRLLNMLIKGRADIIVEDSNVINWIAKKHHIEIQKIRKSGCMKKQPFYLALYPSSENSKLIKQLDISLSSHFN